MRLVAVLGTLLVLSLASGASSSPQTRCVSPPKPPRLFVAIVSHVVDGDTIHVRLTNGPLERVRLIGIDTPEVYEGAKLERDVHQSGRPRAQVQALGRRASAFTKRHLAGRAVGLEYDVQRRDPYGRLLAYVWLARQGLFNALILREGYAQILTRPPNVKYAALFLACQREAREKGRGLWSR
jgi:micrococcal nuclease